AGFAGRVLSGGRSDGRPLSYAQVAAMPPTVLPFWDLLQLVDHELGHAWQVDYDASFSSLWSGEGGASAGSIEIARRHLGHGLLENWVWYNFYYIGPEGSYAAGVNSNSGRFVTGYNEASGFLFDLICRRVQTGEPLDSAMRQVLGGAMEGWFGVS